MKLRWLFLICLICLIGALIPSMRAADKHLLPDSVEEAWKEVENAAKPPPQPEEWGGKRPTAEQQEEFRKLLGNRSAEAARKAREFYLRFPKHEKAESAKAQQARFVQQALNFGATELPSELEETVSAEERLKIKMNAVNRKAMAKQSGGMDAVTKELETGLRGLIKDHPESPAPWAQMLVVAQNASDRDHAKKLLAEITDSAAADEETKARAAGILRKFGAVGRPLALSFTATDGTKVDVQAMKGKVVLVDFWASWCGPCLVSFPEVTKLYETYHEKGLEILGINMDKQRPPMDAAIERFQLPWKQYYDGRGWGNRFALEYNVNAIPAMWLVDKKGILRSVEAREDLEGRIKELLAEPFEADKL